MSPPNPAITLRPREPSDLPTLIEILTHVHSITGYPVDADFAEKLQSANSLLSIIALSDGRIAGHFQIKPATSLNPAVEVELLRHGPLTDFAILVSLFVDPLVQGEGIGRRMVEEAMAWAKREGKRLVLVVLEKDQAAIRMYQRMRWERSVEYFYDSITGIRYRAFLFLAPEYWALDLPVKTESAVSKN